MENINNETNVTEENESKEVKCSLDPEVFRENNEFSVTHRATDAIKNDIIDIGRNIGKCFHKGFKKVTKLVKKNSSSFIVLGTITLVFTAGVIVGRK